MQRRQDLSFVALAAVHGAVVLAAPFAPLIALGVWWNSNTIAHNFIHRPFFRAAPANRLFALMQTALLGIPQTLWRQRHLAHHADVPWRFQWSWGLGIEVGLILTVWAIMAVRMPTLFVEAYVPGYLTGLLLCGMHGYFEHAGGTTSCYGRFYNRVCFNDGFHHEHHAWPGVHWSDLPGRRSAKAQVSRWPPLLRWLDVFSLNGLERLVLRSAHLQTFVLTAHRRAMTKVLTGAPPIRRVLIVGGGLFPRSALVLRQLLPDASLVIVDAEQAHLDSARALLDGQHAERAIEYRHGTFITGDACPGVDLLVVPLAFRGDRQSLYANPPTPLLLVHDWCWCLRGQGCLVSMWLLKRLNLVRR